MKSLTLAATIAALATLAETKQCFNLSLPVPVTYRNAVFNLTAPASDIETTDFILNLLQQGKNYTQAVLEGYQTYSKVYQIGATYCQPDSGPGKYLQLLTHGIGFDRSYWDIPFANYNYSYVNVAVDQYGYSTFAWDRTGIAQSGPHEPVNEVQQYLEVETLHSLTTLLQAGQIPGISAKFPNIIHGGHSFGSEHTYALTAKYPDISAGIFLTGFSQNGSFIPYFGFGGNFVEANTNPALTKYPNGYFAAGDASAVQTNFFSPGMFSPAVLQFATQTGQPVTVGELLTISSETLTPSTFGRPVFVITGERDIPYCGGNCYGGVPPGSSIPAMAAKTLPNAKPFQAYIVPGAGHGLNLEYSHPTTYSKINQFLAANGLAAK